MERRLYTGSSDPDGCRYMESKKSTARAARVGERVELRLAHLPARLAKQDVVIGLRIKRRVEIDDRHWHQETLFEWQ